MKVAIISDIHDNEVNLNKFFIWAKENNIEKIICPGDVTNSDTIKMIAKNFSGEIFLVRGNVDNYNEKDLVKYDNIINGGETAVFEIEGKRFGLCHEPFKIKKVLEQESANSRDRKVETIFYGHTHKPWIEDKDKVKLVNPGNLAGSIYMASFAVWDTSNNAFELKILDLI